MCPVITAVCFWNMDTIESWYSETGGLSYDEVKTNAWHPLLWICHEWGSRHTLTVAVHKAISRRRHSLWPCQAYGQGCSCPPSPTSLRPDMTGPRTVWHPEKTTRSSVTILSGASHHKHMVLSFWHLECCDKLVSIDDATTRTSTVKCRERERQRERDTLHLVPLKEETSQVKCSGMARVVKTKNPRT